MRDRIPVCMRRGTRGRHGTLQREIGRGDCSEGVGGVRMLMLMPVCMLVQLVVSRTWAHGRRVRVLRQQRVDDGWFLFDHRRMMLLLETVTVTMQPRFSLDVRLLLSRIRHLVVCEHGLLLRLRGGGGFLGLGLLCARAPRVRRDAFHVLSESREAHACCVAVCDFELLRDEVPVDLERSVSTALGQALGRW